MIVYADSWRTGTCRSCGAPIEWVTQVRPDRAIPFNPPIVFARQLFDTLETKTQDVDLVRSVLHYVTCPHAQAWRKQYLSGGTHSW